MKLKLLFWIIGILLILPIFVNADLIAHYLCDETSGTAIEDSMGTYDSTVSSASIWNADGKIGRGCYPDDLYYINDINFGTISDWTITFWWKPDDTYGPSVWNQFISDVGAYGGVGSGSNTGIELMNSAGAQSTATVPAMSAGVWHHVIVTQTSGAVNVYMNNTASISNPLTKYVAISGLTGLLVYRFEAYESIPDGRIDDIRIYNEVITAANRSFIFNSGAGTQDNYSTPIPPDTTPPNILSYNLSAPSGYCTSWPSGTCTTGDTTPTVTITTDDNATCAIGRENWNYTTLYNYSGINRSCENGGTKSLICTLRPEDQLTEETSYIYIGCKNIDGYESSSSTSGALKLSIHSSDLESRGRYGIETGIQGALLNSYTIYTDQKIYARNSANNQSIGVFDKVVKWMNKIWAFNFLTGNDTAVGMFNITPVLYTLEMRNITNSTVNTTVYNFIMSTK